MGMTPEERALSTLESHDGGREWFDQPKLVAELTRLYRIEDAIKRLADWPCDGEGPRQWCIDMMTFARVSLKDSPQ